MNWMLSCYIYGDFIKTRESPLNMAVKQVFPST